MNRKIIAVLGEDAVAAECAFSADYLDDNGSGGQSTGSSVGATSGTIPVTVVDDPPDGVAARTATEILIYNGDTITHRVILQLNDSGTLRGLARFFLSPGQTGIYVRGRGFNIFPEQPCFPPQSGMTVAYIRNGVWQITR